MIAYNFFFKNIKKYLNFCKYKKITNKNKIKYITR